MRTPEKLIASLMARNQELESILALANAALRRSIDAERKARETVCSLVIQLGKTRIPTFADAQIVAQIN